MDRSKILLSAAERGVSGQERLIFCGKSITLKWRWPAAPMRAITTVADGKKNFQMICRGTGRIGPDAGNTAGTEPGRARKGYGHPHRTDLYHRRSISKKRRDFVRWKRQKAAVSGVLSCLSAGHSVTGAWESRSTGRYWSG